VAVSFTREANGDWLLLMIVDGKTLPTITIPKRQQVRACWVSACDYLRAATDAPKTSRREIKLPTQPVLFSPPRIAQGTEESKPKRMARKFHK
jgi:hypothetical protein